MNKKLIAFLSILSLFLSSPHIPANAAAKAGAKCTKAGNVEVVKDKSYTCVKSGKKLIWDKGSVLKNNIQDNYQNSKAELEKCRVKETQNIAIAASKGFPLRSALPPTGDLKVVIIPIDFSNAVGIGKPGDMYADDLKKITDWSTFFSRGKMSYKPVLASKSWIRAPKGADWYTRKGEKGGSIELQSPSSALQELISIADQFVDFTDTKFVYFIFPESAEKNYGTFIYSGIVSTVPVNTSEGVQQISSYGEFGGAYMSADRTNIWDHLIHELLHFQGFIGHGPKNGSGLGIMQGQWGNSKAVTTWEAFLAGWFGDNEIICVEKDVLTSSVSVTLGSIDKFDSKPVSVIIKLSDTEVIVIEKRADGIFTNFGERKEFSYFPELTNFVGKSNFTSYYINVNAAQYRDDSDPNSDTKNFWFYIRESGNIAIRKSVTFKDLRIEVQPYDQIKISKTS
jgi:hypothetical protein